MDFIIAFFRDTIDGFWYFLYILACIFFIFVLLGVIGDRKRAAIEEQLKEKKARDIASGKEAKIAAMESKQILDVMTDDSPDEAVKNEQVPTDVSNTEGLAKKDEAPAILVIGADGSSNVNSSTTTSVPANNVSAPVLNSGTSPSDGQNVQG